MNAPIAIAPNGPIILADKLELSGNDPSTKPEAGRYFRTI
jgi:hypothetical protein